jgi:hypothetical protein
MKHNTTYETISAPRITGRVCAGRHTLSTTTLNIAELYAGMRAGEALATGAHLTGLESYQLSGGSIRFHENYVRSMRKVKQPAVVLFTWR